MRGLLRQDFRRVSSLTAATKRPVFQRSASCSRESVIVLRHETSDPQHGGVWRQDELRSDDLVVVRERQRGAIVDERIMPERIDGWSAARFVVRGPLATERADLREGDVLFLPTYGDAPARTLDDELDTITILWRSGGVVGEAVSTADTSRPSPRASLALRRLAESLAAEGPPLVREATLGALDALRAEGLPLSREPHLALPTQDEMEVARAVEQVLLPLSRQPMATDLARALCVCERHAMRRVNAYFARYYRSLTTWRDYVRGMRVLLGTFFIAQPKATTESVSRLLGFSSPTSLCHAFRDADLPSPLAVKRALAA